MHLLEGGRDAGHRHEVDRAAEAVEGGQVAVGPGGAEVGDAEVLLDGPRAGDEFPKDRLQAVARQRSGARRGHPLEHRLLAGGIVGSLACVLFEMADLPGHFRPVVHQAHQFAVDPVDLRAE